jgi:hypothetical protein
MANSWITFVKAWSIKHGKSYMCSVSDPKCKSDYANRMPASMKRSIKRIKQSRAKEANENSGMGRSDVNVGRPMTHTEIIKMKNNMLSQRFNPTGLGPVSFMGSKYF